MKPLFAHNRGTDPDLWRRFTVRPYRVSPDSAGRFHVEPQSRCPENADLNLFGHFRLLPDVIWLGGGCEPYPEKERQERLTRRMLEVIARHACPTVILTANPLILRDVDLLGEIAEQSQATVALMTSCLNLPGGQLEAATDNSNSERLEALKRLKRVGVHAGLGVFPQAPGVNDDPVKLAALFHWSRQNQADFLFFPSIAFRSLLSSEFYHSDSSSAAPYRMLWEKKPPLSAEFLSWRRSLFVRLFTLASEYDVPLRLHRPVSMGIYRENQWLAGRLADVAFYRRLQVRSFHIWLNAAQYLDRLDCDVRNILRYQAVEDLKWMDQRVTSSFRDLVSGKWSGRAVPWQWLRDV